MHQFLKDKQGADSAGAPQALVSALHSLTGLRALLAGGLSSGELLSLLPESPVLIET